MAQTVQTNSARATELPLHFVSNCDDEEKINYAELEVIFVPSPWWWLHFPLGGLLRLFQAVIQGQSRQVSI